MNKTEIAAREANLAQKMDSLLKTHDICYSRQTIKRRYRDIFDIIFDNAEKGLLEQRISVYVHDRLIFFEASVPVTRTSNDDVAALVNTLNIEHPMGSYQYDIRDGELNWTHYLPAREGEWPGDGSVLSVLTTAQEMAARLYRALLSENTSLTTIKK